MRNKEREDNEEEANKGEKKEGTITRKKQRGDEKQNEDVKETKKKMKRTIKRNEKKKRKEDKLAYAQRIK